MTHLKLSHADQQLLLARRWRARSDKLWLARHILGYDRLTDNIHGAMAKHLQKFPLPTEAVGAAADKWGPNGFEYTPWNDPYDLPGWRNVLLLFSRGYYKTTINTITDTIQWALNYPHLAFVILFSTDQKAQDTIREIKRHFQTNHRLRELFPDYCPQKRVEDWGNAESFVLPNRDGILRRLNKPPRKEPSVMTLSIDKAGVGYHFDVLKCSDIVDPTNTVTPMQREQVKYRFSLLPNLLVKVPNKRPGWINVEGTFYHPDDLHSQLVRSWRKQLPEQRNWDIFIGGCFKRNTGVAQPRYDPNEMMLPFLEVNGHRVPTWPEMDSIETLEKEEADELLGGITFAYQRILDTDAVRDVFMKPLTIPMQWTKREDFRTVPVVYHVTVVDAANSSSAKANPSCISTFGVDRAGRAYLHDVRYGKLTPDQLIECMFDVQKKYAPIRIVLEETGFIQGLRPSIERYSHVNGVYPNWDFHPAPRTIDKATRIINALQPPLKSGNLRFVEPFNVVDTKGNTIGACQPSDFIAQTLRDELNGVTPQSTGNSDDIIDTLAYFYLSRSWLGREKLRDGSYQEGDAHARLLREALEPNPLPEAIHRDAFRKMVFEKPFELARTENFGDRAGW